MEGRYKRGCAHEGPWALSCNVHFRTAMTTKAFTRQSQYSPFRLTHLNFCSQPPSPMYLISVYEMLSGIAACHKVFESFHQNCKQSNSGAGEGNNSRIHLLMLQHYHFLLRIRAGRKRSVSGWYITFTVYPPFTQL